MKSLGLVLLVALLAPTAAFLGWNLPQQQQPAKRSPVTRDARGMLVDVAQIKEFDDLMAAIRLLEENGLMKIQPNGRVSVPAPSYKGPKPLCGRAMTEKVTSLCLSGCTTGQDVASLLCGLGLTDSEVIEHCCPDSYREPTVKHFVF